MTLTEHSKVYIARARQRKAIQMAFLAWADGISSSDMKCADADQWTLLHTTIGRQDVPSPETRQMTIAAMERLEAQGARAA